VSRLAGRARRRVRRSVASRAARPCAATRSQPGRRTARHLGARGRGQHLKWFKQAAQAPAHGVAALSHPGGRRFESG
jgi:hypothetical protein